MQAQAKKSEDKEKKQRREIKGMCDNINMKMKYA
jgi:hypothetical protein